MNLQIQRIVNKNPVGITMGKPRLRHHIKKCPACKKEYPYEQIDTLVPRYGNYAYDVIIKVGLARYRRFYQNKEIQEHIQNHYSLLLPESSINDLANHFLDYLAAVHYASIGNIRQLLDDNGGYACHVDGTCEAGTDIIFTAIDEISCIVLLTDRMPTENVNDIKSLLKKCRDWYGIPLATMSDLSSNIAAAIKEVFKGSINLVCQYHFLENVGKALFQKTHQELTVLLRELKIRAGLRTLRNGLVQRSKNESHMTGKEFEAFLANPDKQSQFDNDALRKHLIYFIFQWLKDYGSELKGEYFPFDQPSLVFYKRCAVVYDLLNELLKNNSSFKKREQQTLRSIIRVLEPAKKNKQLTIIAENLEKQVNCFNELRKILRFSRPDNKPILRQRPPNSTVKDARLIKGRLNKFIKKLEKIIITDNDLIIVSSSKTIVKYLNKYFDKLVGHVIELPGNKLIILLDRTNNIPETRFGKIKGGWRRKLGLKKLTRYLQSARHEELLVANLKNQDYINAVYGGSIDNMADYFAKYSEEALEIRKKRKDNDINKNMPIIKICQ